MTSSPLTPRASRTGRRRCASSTGATSSGPPAWRAGRSRQPRGCSRSRRRPCSAGRWASPSTTTPSRRSRSSSTSRCSRATSASRARGSARCGVTPTSRATGRWGSGNGRPALPRRAARRVRLRAAAEHGLDTVAAIQALRDGEARVFIGMGGNFVSAAPDTEVTEKAFRSAELTVHVSTKLNRSHVVTGREALILPALGRSEKDRTGDGSSESPSRTRCRPSTLRGSAQAGVPTPAVRGRHRLLDRGGDHRRPARPSVERLPVRLHRDPQADRPGGPGLRGVRREGGPARRVRPSAPAARLSHVRDLGRQGDVQRLPARGARGAGGPAAAADAALARPVQHHHLRPRRPLPRDQGRPAGGLRPPRRHRGPGLRRRRHGRPGQRVARRLRAHRAGLPGGFLRPAARLCGGLLPRDQPVGPARLHGRGQQHAHVEVGDRPAAAEVRQGVGT